MVDGLAKAKHIALRAEMPRALPMVTADERACRQVMINLLSNAIKFSKDGGEVVVSMRRQGRHLALTVADHGIGMAPDAVQRIGEPFFQAQDGLSRQYEGTGLGLSIVKGLIDLHDGELQVRSTLGEGTRVTVLLPLNGPATKLAETPVVTQIRPEPAAPQMPEWRDEKRKAL
jgi:cell cycle sensor histidine kinase DivJ